MTAYKLQAKVGDFAAHLETDDFLALVRDPDTLNELQPLIDRYMVLHISPQRELCTEAVGRFAVHLGMPMETAARGPRRSEPLSAEYPFIGDFSTPAREAPKEPRIPSYIETLHYDGISAYSVQATFNTPPTTPNLWSDMRAAYRSLPGDLRKIVDDKHALHAVIPPPGSALADFPGFDDGTVVRRPLRIRHPRTGEPLLYLPKNPASRIEGMATSEGMDVLHALWAHTNTHPTRYTALAAHNQMFVWDGLGTTHTNPAYPRDKPRTLWFFIIPGAKADVDDYVAL